MAGPVSIQPGGSSELFPFNNHWQNGLLASFKPCPRSAYACFCGPCHTSGLTKRIGDHMLTCLANPCVLMTIRTKVRTAFKLQESLLEDCYSTTCCVAPCAAMQIEKELDYQNISGKREK